MLTGDLVRLKVGKDKLSPRYVDASDPLLLDLASAMVELGQDAAKGGWAMGELDDQIEGLLSEGVDLKLGQGLAKVLSDRLDVGVESSLVPEELRSAVFRRARERGPIVLTAEDPLNRPTAKQIFEEVGAELGADAETVARGLYADLPEAQIVRGCDVPDGSWLLHRYNVALVQAALLRAERLSIRLKGAKLPRLRQLYRLIKFHQLVHHTIRDGDQLEIVLDGPTSALHQSTRYGMQLATFLPGLLLQEGWSAEATVRWVRGKPAKTLSVAPADGLRSHARDVGAWESPVQKWFRERWTALGTDWELIDGEGPLMLSPRTTILPDFSFRRGGKVAHLEILGFWRQDWLERHLRSLKESGRTDLILALSRKMRLDSGDRAALEAVAPIIDFAEVVPAKAVLEAVERVAK